MTQVYLPADPHVRRRLEGGGRGAVASPTQPLRPAARPRRFGVIDVTVMLAVAAAITLLVMAAARWTAPATPVVHIDLSPSVLPEYAGYSLLRMILAYLLSLAFTFVYGHIAAMHRRAERVMIPLLDVLQSIPILSFLPIVTLALVAAFPHSNVGMELASVILIFTSQAWNMTFSFYHSAKTQPVDLQEASTIARLRPWRRFVTLEVPSSMIGLIWNSMMSWAGGWFFLMASEQFVSGSRSFQLPGLGSYLQAAANAGNTTAILCGLFTLVLLIVLLDQLFWRPVVAWADKFKLEQSSGPEAPHSFVLDALHRSALVDMVNRRVFRPLGRLAAGLLDRLQPLPDTSSPEKSGGQRSRVMVVRRAVGRLCLLLLGVLVLFGLWSMIRELQKVPHGAWSGLPPAALATWGRTLTAMLIGAAWTVPVGVAIGLSPRWSRRLQPVVQVVASIPATALFPVLLIFLLKVPSGLEFGSVLLMLMGTQWYILFNVLAGAMAIPTDLREAATVYHATGWRKWRTLILPGIFPYLVTGLLTASGGAWNASIVSEYVQFGNQTHSTLGLGATIAEAAAAGNFPLLLAATLIMAAFVVFINVNVWQRMYALAARRYTLA